MKIAHVTLHVGLGTFRPVKVENVQDHHMHSEFYIVEESEAKKVNDTRAAGGRVICVGTTSCRTVESASTEDGVLKAGTGWTEIFIYPATALRYWTPDYEFPSAPVHAGDAGQCAGRTGAHTGCLPGSCEGRLPFLFLWGRYVYCSPSGC